ncbi:S26 family signal peptidase [Natronobacterium gregoryi]|uniref:Peptidase S24/S26A/S26B n=2 Tax=Natronobacterium gregoryi TaxID=44930 RepID=L0AFV9_NATGS|nr:S26 family signal peptidase [Natronobacterium gregoryi]AFZ72798.1 signal peptidase I [Natronobacterium gregoryi SP2]ELY69437.1 peptidase S24/S26A/S26B [Natronobacterium gregoryi SP2]PLK21138.1 S26 family signal peptidase [Natronobacterium gregoryi SP2]SFJ10478.1 signal peptidase, endoplasmic reticulum-type [Natronobacterium gregoryi]
MSGPDAGDSDGYDDQDRDSTASSSDTSEPDERRIAERESTDNSQDVTIENDGLVRWFLETDDEPIVLVRDIVTSVAIVAAIALLLFAISGVWPPLVAVESGSMEPSMERGDMIVVVDEERFAGDDPVEGTGVVTVENGQDGGHETFGEPGDVVVFRPDGSELQTPVIHRAHFWVEEDENWVDTKAKEEYVGGASCDDLRTCPANHDGFVTKGDANSGYDQYQGGATTDVVKPEWVTGKATLRIPWLGHIRLLVDELLASILVPSATIGATGATGAAIAGADIVRTSRISDSSPNEHS